MASILPEVRDLTPEQRAIYDMLPINLTRGLLMTRSNAAPYLELGRSFHSSWLPPDLREMIILRVGAVTETDYEIFHHVRQARASGVPDELIHEIVSGSCAVGDENLNALIVFVDHLVRAVRTGPPSIEIVEKYFSHNEIAEIVLLVGHYIMTSLFVKVLGIEPEETAASPAISADER